jgi:protein-L-isoaspartate(D-aspartate) O-methyltransferase
MKNKYGLAGAQLGYRFEQSQHIDRREIVLASTETGAINHTKKKMDLPQQREHGLSLMREQMVVRLDNLLKLTQPNKEALLNIPRHFFVDQRLWSRAYEEMVLPIGFGQTMSRPSVVAKILQAAFPEKSKSALNVLEIGAGCGYLTALIAHHKHRVIAVERVESLLICAVRNLRTLALPIQPQLKWADGNLGAPKQAPFDVIVMSAACDRVPLRLLDQMADGGRLVFPMNPFADQTHQDLTVIEKISAKKFRTSLVDKVQFVPLLPGLQSKEAFKPLDLG